MNNRVTHVIYKAFAEMGCPVIRFNFRGVGLSDGEHGDGIGELTDTMFVLDWMQSINDVQRPIVVAGYSFGAWIVMQLLMRRPEVNGFISVCPPANAYDFSFLAPCPVPGMIIMGDKDNICSISEVDKLVDRLNAQKGVSIDYRVLKDCDHMFTDKLDELKQAVKDYIGNMLVTEKIA